MKTIAIYDSDRTIKKADFGYSELTIRELQDYADIMWLASVVYNKCMVLRGEINVDLNVLRKKFRLQLFAENQVLEDELNFIEEDRYVYKNGNLKFLENIQYLLNIKHGLATCDGSIKGVMESDGSWHGTYGFLNLANDQIYSYTEKYPFEKNRLERIGDLIFNVYKYFQDDFVNVGFGAY